MTKSEINQQSKENTNKRMLIVNKNYRERMREKGMYYFCMWIPKGILEKVKKYIEERKND